LKHERTLAATLSSEDYTKHYERVEDKMIQLYPFNEVEKQVLVRDFLRNMETLTKMKQDLIDNEVFLISLNTLIGLFEENNEAGRNFIYELKKYSKTCRTKDELISSIKTYQPEEQEIESWESVEHGNGSITSLPSTLAGHGASAVKSIITNTWDALRGGSAVDSTVHATCADITEGHSTVIHESPNVMNHRDLTNNAM